MTKGIVAATSKVIGKQHQLAAGSAVLLITLA